MEVYVTAEDDFCFRPHFKKKDREFGGAVRNCLHDNSEGYLRKERRSVSPHVTERHREN
jgi:hypothetical protein